MNILFVDAKSKYTTYMYMLYAYATLLPNRKVGWPNNQSLAAKDKSWSLAREGVAVIGCKHVIGQTKLHSRYAPWIFMVDPPI